MRPSCYSQYKYLINVAFQAKRRIPMVSASSSAHHRPPPTGEDAYFYRLSESSNAAAFAVADGVGGWAEMNVDPSEFSTTLCSNMETWYDSHPRSSPLELLTKSYNKLKGDGIVKAGSSTACVGTADVNGMLNMANLGDSAYFIFRQGRLLKQSIPQLWSFNAPYQLSVIPHTEDRVKYLRNTPSDADVASLQLNHGDVVIVASDGLTDNVFPNEILRVVTQLMLTSKSWIVTNKSGITPGDFMSGSGAIARELVKQAHSFSLNARRMSPFAKELEKVSGSSVPGGKPDDITILVMLVEGSEKTAPQSKL